MAMLVAMMGSPPAAGDSVVAQLQGRSPIRDDAGIQVFSVLEGRDYHLAIRRGGSVEVLPVATSKSPFDADIGHDAQGNPVLVYSRCKGSASAPRCWHGSDSRMATLALR